MIDLNGAYLICDTCNNELAIDIVYVTNRHNMSVTLYSQNCSHCFDSSVSINLFESARKVNYWPEMKIRCIVNYFSEFYFDISEAFQYESVEFISEALENLEERFVL
jgi:hypothetical protein